MSELIHICDKCKLLKNCAIGSRSAGKIIGCPSYVKEAPTNADRIRAMTDEELAVWIAGISECPACPKGGKDCDAWTCDGAWLDWLKQEAKDG